MATAPIRPLPWEPPYAVGGALEKEKRQKKKKDGNVETEAKVKLFTDLVTTLICSLGTVEFFHLEYFQERSVLHNSVAHVCLCLVDKVAS